MKLAILAALLSCPALISAQQQTGRVTPVRTANPPRLDGVLDESWSAGAHVTSFYQREPFEGQPATERTDVSILYDDRHLYFGVHCYDSNPKGILATELRRDADYTVNDHFSILISPNDDHRNGYIFTVNPLGTQSDELIADQGNVDDVNWDGIWKSDAKITSDGWTATIAIPYSTLNFKTYETVDLGINFRRFIRRKNEEDLWRSYLRIYGLMRVSQAGELTDLKNIGSGRLLLIKPYLLGGVRSFSGGNTDFLHTGGLDLKYGIKSNLVANLTMNADFADADVDAQRVNLSPFRLSLPEKRPFFLENSGILKFGSPGSTELFFSRQIGIDPVTGEQVPLDVGVKVTGSLGQFDVGILDAHTRESGPNPAANYFVARVKRRLLSESYVGAIAIDKKIGDPHDKFNRGSGIDANFLLWKKLTLSGYWAKTFSYAPQLQGRAWTSNVNAAFTSNLLQVKAYRSEVQPNFNPEVGFVDRTDLVTNVAEIQLSPRPKSGPIREYNFLGFIDYQPDTKGVLQTQEWQTTFRANFHNGAYTDDDLFDNFIQRLTTPFNIFKNVFIPAGLYHYDRHQFTYGSNQSRHFVYNFFERFGSYYNGSLNELQFRQTYQPNARLALSASESWDRFKLAGQLYNVELGSLSTSYSFSRSLTTSALVQVNTIERDPVSLNLRLRYTYRSDSDLFVIYNLGSQFNSIAGGNPKLTREARLSVKFTYSFLR